MLKSKNIFYYLFIVIIIGLFMLPILWNKFGKEVINDLYYREYTLSNEVSIVENNDNVLELSYDSDTEGDIYLHLIYEDYDKDIIDFKLNLGKNNLVITKKDKVLKNVYIYIDNKYQYKWILLEL